MQPVIKVEVILRSKWGFVRGERVLVGADTGLKEIDRETTPGHDSDLKNAVAHAAVRHCNRHFGVSRRRSIC